VTADRFPRNPTPRVEDSSIVGVYAREIMLFCAKAGSVR
jgi:hypothetical protein